MFNRKTAGLAFIFALLILVLVSFGALAEEKGQLVEKSHPRDTSNHRVSPDCASCESCHRCENPTRQNPCLVACPRYEGYFHTKHNADEGPDIVIIDQLANYYRPVIFAHKLHAEMSTMTGGCENCHHYSEQSGVIPACRECHEPESATANLGQPALKGAYHRQCINCHLDWSHENACEFCHDQADGNALAAAPDTTDIIGIPHPKIEATATYVYDTSYEEGPLVTFHHQDHVKMFGQNCVDCHRGDSCGRCHDEKAREPARFDHLTTCCSCHGERDCSFCHNTETQPKFEHALSTGWPLEPYHTEVGCVVCHGDPSSFRHPGTTCTECHIHWEVGSFNHAVTKLTLDEEHVDLDCDSCHLDMDFSVSPSCEDCHDEPMFPERMPGKRQLH